MIVYLLHVLDYTRVYSKRKNFSPGTRSSVVFSKLQVLTKKSSSLKEEKTKPVAFSVPLNGEEIKEEDGNLYENTAFSGKFCDSVCSGF